MAGFGAAGYFSVVLAEAELDEAFVEAVLFTDLELDTPVADVWFACVFFAVSDALWSLAKVWVPVA